MADVVEPKKAGRFKRALVTLGIGAGVLGAAYGTGRVQTYFALSDTEKSLKQETERATRLEARRDLDLALREIDRRNFGLAADRVRAASGLLARSQPEGGLADLAKQIGGTKLAAGDDVAKQREQLLALIDRFDALVPPAKP